jgi:hypothetical protein
MFTVAIYHGSRGRGRTFSLCSPTGVVFCTRCWGQPVSDRYCLALVCLGPSWIPNNVPGVQAPSDRAESHSRMAKLLHQLSGCAIDPIGLPNKVTSRGRKWYHPDWRVLGDSQTSNPDRQKCCVASVPTCAHHLYSIADVPTHTSLFATTRLTDCSSYLWLSSPYHHAPPPPPL